MLKRFFTLAGVLLVVTGLYGDEIIDFESPDYSGSADGVLLWDQQDWYNPVNGSNPFFVFTYEDNKFGLPTNPKGSDQFVAGIRGDVGTQFARGQRDFPFASADEWELGFDLAARFTGEHPADEQWVGSFSLQPFGAVGNPSHSGFILIYQWVDVNTTKNFNATYVVYDRNGNSAGFPPGLSPGDAWANLEADHWYRLSAKINFKENRFTEVSITDLNTNDTTTVVDPKDPDTGDFYYLGGGEGGGGKPIPTGLRFFTGGGNTSTFVPGNVTAWDRLLVSAGAPCEPCDTNCDGSVDLVDVESFIELLLGGKQCAPDCSGDTNEDGSVDLTDVEGFIECLLG